MINYNSVLSQLIDFGLDIKVLEVNTTRPVRCIHQFKPQEKAGWYWLSSFVGNDGKEIIAGSYGYFSGNDSNKQNVIIAKSDKEAMSGEALKAIKTRITQDQKRLKSLRLAEIAKAKAIALKTWKAYQVEGKSKYLENKSVKAHGIRFSPKQNGTFAVPMCDQKGQIFGLQIVRSRKAAMGKQFYPKGMESKGKYHLIGGLPTRIVLIAEGYATAATLFEATGFPVAVCFSAHNISHVAQLLKKCHPRAKIVVCADDDYLTQGNPGVTCATNAARLVDGLAAVPLFPKGLHGDDLRNGEKLTDFNDLANFPECGLHTVRSQIEEIVKDINLNPSYIHSNSPQKPSVRAILSIDEIVERYIYIDSSTGDEVFDTVANEIVKTRKVISQLPAHSTMNDIKSHPTWQERAVRMEEIGFDPTGKNSKIKCNLYNGWTTTAKNDATEADCQKILGLLKFLLSNEKHKKEEILHWMLCWLAYPIQNPGAKLESAPIFHGPQGTGKSMFFGVMEKIYGDYGNTISQGTLEDQFNSDWAEKKLFIIAEELIADENKRQHKNAVKILVTGDSIRINRKMVEARTERNFFNIVFLSNEMNPYVLENGDRRHLVIWTPQANKSFYYEEIQKEIENGGREAFHQYLLNYDTGNFTPSTKPPHTTAKQDLIDLNLSSQHWFLKCWENGEIPDLAFGPVPCQGLFKFYVRWCQKQNEKYPGSLKIFGARVHSYGWEMTRSAKKIIGEKHEFYKHYTPAINDGNGDFFSSKALNYFAQQNKIRVRFYVPPVEKMNYSYLEGFKTRIRKQEESEEMYFSKCYYEFFSDLNLSNNDDQEFDDYKN